MNIMKKILPVVLSFVLGGCLEDNGNYEYNDLLKMQVSTTPSASLIEGETKGFTAMVYILDENGKIREDVEDVELGYEWRINSEIVSTDSRYLFEATEQGEFAGHLRVYDVATGATYGFPFNISVTSPYETGFLVLSEEDGYTALHMIRSSKIAGDYYMRTNDTLLFKNEYMNVFAKEMGGEVLEGKPLSIMEHHAINDYDVNLFGEITIMTDNNGKRIVQDLNGLTLKRETFITQEFSASGLPDNFNPKQTVCAAWDNYVLDEDGRVYARRLSDGGGYHLGTYDKEVPLYGSALFSDLIYTYYPKFHAILALELVDDGNGGKQRNYVGIYEAKGSPDKNQKRLPFIAPEDSPAGYLNDFIDVKGEIVFSDYLRKLYWEACARQIVVLKNEAGEYILHAFDLLIKSPYTNVQVDNSQKINLTQSLGLTNMVSMFAFKNSDIAYFCDEANIYMYDVINNQITPLGTISEGKIVAMGGQTTENIDGYANKCESSLALGLENGKLLIYEVGKTSHNEIGRCVFESENNYGKIKQIIYKVGRSNRFNNW